MKIFNFFKKKKTDPDVGIERGKISTIEQELLNRCQNNNRTNITDGFVTGYNTIATGSNCLAINGDGKYIGTGEYSNLTGKDAHITGILTGLSKASLIDKSDKSTDNGSD